MSAGKKSPAKSKARAGSVKWEYAGDWLRGNIWFSVGLAKTEAAMLKAIGRRIFRGRVSSACVARLLLLHALAHYDKLEPLILQDATYSESEGFCITDDYLHGVIAGQHAKIAEQKGKVKS